MPQHLSIKGASKFSKALNYLYDIYCVGKMPFNFRKKSLNVTAYKTSIINYFNNIFCVGKSAFSTPPVRKRPDKKVEKRNIQLNLSGTLIFSVSVFTSHIKNYFAAFLNSFFKLNRINQSVITGCLIIIVIVSTVPVWFIHWQNNLGTDGIQQSSIIPYSAPLNSVSGRPIGLKIPSLQIDLPVINGGYNPKTHNWTLTDNNVQYLVDSAQPNNISGKTFIYGHALKSIFGDLHNIQPGASLTLVTNNGYSFIYQYDSSFTTTPSDLSVLDNTHQPELYVQTCSGTFYQYRQIFSFKYVGYEKLK